MSADSSEVSGNLDERLLPHWLESRERRAAALTRLERSSLPLERFEGWALEMLIDALSVSGTATVAKSAAAQVRPLLDNR